MHSEVTAEREIGCWTMGTRFEGAGKVIPGPRRNSSARVSLSGNCSDAASRCQGPGKVIAGTRGHPTAAVAVPVASKSGLRLGATGASGFTVNPWLG
jgi:hypothetical protein